MSNNQTRSRERLDYYYRAVQAIILNRQNPTTGLIPASVAVTTHGDYRDAWVRDNVYSIYAVFGLALAYRRLDDDQGRAYELEHAVVKLMRGLLFCMMQQAKKVELFKNTQHLHHCLHAKYSTSTGSTVVGDSEWGHLQLDATSIYLLSLAQMTTAGLNIIYTSDEVDFVQNLVFYIERAYRTPDYGIWERGNKINHGEPELNSSSIGMAVAALQAINGVNLFGSKGGPSSVIHVLPDEITRNYTTLHSALPRESKSKEVDAALLSVIGFPAFAVGDPKLVLKTRETIVSKLGGKYGCKRFLRDGHQTVLEDTTRLHYEAHELKIFEDIECEWPLFFTYLILNGLFSGDDAQVEEYRRALEPLLIDSSTLMDFGQHVREALSSINADDNDAFQRTVGTSPRTPLTPGYLPDHIMLIPELYYVPSHLVNAEKKEPHSQVRVANDNVPLVWANSLFILGNLIYENLLAVSEVDPLGRRLSPTKTHTDAVVQLVLLSENDRLQQKLAMYGLETQTIEQVSPVTISPPSALKEVYTTLGYNAKLGLSGRPRRPVGTLGTSKLYRVQGHVYAFTPHFMDMEEFYLTSDNDYLVSVFEQELTFISQHWWNTGRPTMVVLLTNAMLGGSKIPQHEKHAMQQQARGVSAVSAGTGGSRRASISNSSSDKRNLLQFMMTLRTGVCNGVRVRLGRLSEMVTTSCIESLDFLVNKNEIDWFGILRGASRAEQSRRFRKLGLSGTQTNIAHSKSIPRRSLRRSASGAWTASNLSTPMPEYNGSSTSANDKTQGSLSSLSPTTPSSNYYQPGSYFPGGIQGTSTSFKLRDHEEHRGIPANQRKNVSTFGGSDSDYTGALSARTDRSANVSSPDSTPDERMETVMDGAASEMLALTLSDPINVPAAVSLLTSSVNLFDQIDLLHYLHSCHGAKFVIEPYESSVEDLLEEVYMKALQLRLWSIVRQAAGLLHKVVNSLTINITDLLIRQKQVTIGPSDNEYVISTPLGPEVLSKSIYEHCYDDVREAPLVQEVLTYLGSFIRADSKMFTGIMRVRTHYVIIALREEMSRMKVCDEEDAVELLMQLSPFEMKSLLGTVMSGPTLVGSTSMAADLAAKVGPGIHRNVSLANAERRPPFNAVFPRVSTASVLGSETSSIDGSAASPATAEVPGSGKPTVTVTAQSGGFNAGNFSRIEVNGVMVSVSVRGMNVAVVDPVTGGIIDAVGFDTHLSEEDSEDFAKYIEWLDPGTLVVACCKDDVVESLTEGGKLACQLLGSSMIRNVKYRDSWCLIGQKGSTKDAVLEAHSPAGPTPTQTITKTFDLAPIPSLSIPALALDPRQPTEVIGPSQGRWLRRRKNDGALNRVPADFYPWVWKVLDRSAGIRIDEIFLPRNPTVSEKTPEELNFALQVEHFLAAIRDPAERQIAIETLQVVCRIQERNPEMEIKSSEIDILMIMKDAVISFWNFWVKKSKDQQAEAKAEAAKAQGPAGEAGSLSLKNLGLKIGTTGIVLEDHSFASNEILARRLFYDLPQEGKEGTFSYLAKSALKLLPYSVDSGEGCKTQ